jgi:DMSO/TMAO reductase YedYZ molybdopterin-dependent catalytic subunit
MFGEHALNKCYTFGSATFNNSSVISWQSVLLMEVLEKTINVSQVIDKLYHIMLYTLP